MSKDQELIEDINNYFTMWDESDRLSKDWMDTESKLHDDLPYDYPPFPKDVEFFYPDDPLWERAISRAWHFQCGHALNETPQSERCWISLYALIFFNDLARERVHWSSGVERTEYTEAVNDTRQQRIDWFLNDWRRREKMIKASDVENKEKAYFAQAEKRDVLATKIADTHAYTKEGILAKIRFYENQIKYDSCEAETMQTFLGDVQHIISPQKEVA